MVPFFYKVLKIIHAKEYAEAQKKNEGYFGKEKTRTNLRNIVLLLKKKKTLKIIYK